MLLIDKKKKHDFLSNKVADQGDTPLPSLRTGERGIVDLGVLRPGLNLQSSKPLIINLQNGQGEVLRALPGEEFDRGT